MHISLPVFNDGQKCPELGGTKSCHVFGYVYLSLALSAQALAVLPLFFSAFWR